MGLADVFRADVENCPKCGGAMRWLEVATEPHDAARLMAAHGLGPQPPPVARPYFGLLKRETEQYWGFPRRRFRSDTNVTGVGGAIEPAALATAIPACFPLLFAPTEGFRLRRSSSASLAAQAVVTRPLNTAKL